MELTEFISMAFVMGAIGSLHCLGMCGPIAMALPLNARSSGGKLLGGIIYNLGRIVSYSSLGLVLGLAGDFFITPKIQSSVSIVFGAAILLYLLLPSRLKKSLSKNSVFEGVLLRLRSQFGKLLSFRSNSSLFGIGLLNGFLPCGMIYLALTSSFLTGSAVNGSLFMAAFGFGTFPAMLAIVYFGSYVNQQVRLSLRKAVPVFLICMAALLVLRGLNLGIPYLSPSLPNLKVKAVIPCH